jgi:phage shock protein PspC (stress-responsive transcriptional regulator)
MGDKNAVKEAPVPLPEKRLYRSRSDRKIAGVLGGFAEFFGLDSSFIRIAYVVATALTMFAPLMALYILMVFIIPTEPKRRAAGS